MIIISVISFHLHDIAVLQVVLVCVFYTGTRDKNCFIINSSSAPLRLFIPCTSSLSFLLEESFSTFFSCCKVESSPLRSYAPITITIICIIAALSFSICSRFTPINTSSPSSFSITQPSSFLPFDSSPSLHKRLLCSPLFFGLLLSELAASVWPCVWPVLSCFFFTEKYHHLLAWFGHLLELLSSLFTAQSYIFF